MKLWRNFNVNQGCNKINVFRFLCMVYGAPKQRIKVEQTRHKTWITAVQIYITIKQIIFNIFVFVRSLQCSRLECSWLSIILIQATPTFLFHTFINSRKHKRTHKIFTFSPPSIFYLPFRLPYTRNSFALKKNFFHFGTIMKITHF